jgi:hypothetical protein
MLVITQGNVNKLVVTLTEKKVTDSNIYLIEFVNQESKNKYYVVGQDVSVSPNRYNEFCITETTGSSGTTNPFNEQIQLPLSGFYFYNVYENPNSVIISTGLNQVETGKVLVLVNPASIVKTPTYKSAVNPGLIVYNG